MAFMEKELMIKIYANVSRFKFDPYSEDYIAV